MVFQTRLDKFIFILKPLWQASRERYIGHARTRHHRRTGLARKDAQASFGPSTVPHSHEVDGGSARPSSSDGLASSGVSGTTNSKWPRRRNPNAIQATARRFWFNEKGRIIDQSQKWRSALKTTATKYNISFRDRRPSRWWGWSCRSAGPELRGARAAAVRLHLPQNYSPSSTSAYE